jgi:hypothetical protein
MKDYISFFLFLPINGKKNYKRMLTRQKIKGHFVMLSFFSIFLVTSCQNDASTKSESSAENKEVTAKKATLKDVHFDCSMVMGNDKMLYLKYNNVATGMGAVLSCTPIEAKDFKNRNIPVAALAACSVESAQGNAVFYAIKNGDAIYIFKENANSKIYTEHLIIPLI